MNNEMTYKTPSLFELFFESCKSEIESLRHMAAAKKEVVEYEKYNAKWEKDNKPSSTTNNTTQEATAPVKEEELKAETKQEETKNNCTTVSKNVWNKKKKSFEKTDVQDEDMYVNIYNEMDESSYMSNDQMENFIDDTIRAINPDEKDIDINRIILCVLLKMVNKITIENCYYEMNGKQNSAEIFNSFWKYFMDSPVFASISTYDISEYISFEKLLKLMMALNYKEIFSKSILFGPALEKVRKDYRQNQKKEKSHNGAKQISSDDIVSPIVFNNSILSNVDLETGQVPAPKINSKLKKYIINKFKEIIDNDEISLDMEAKVGQFVGMDTGCGWLKLTNKNTNQTFNALLIDLNTIAGTGINVIWSAFDENNKAKYLNYHHMAFLNIEDPEHVEIIKKILKHGPEFIIGKEPLSNRKEYESVMSSCLDISLYKYFDFSDTNRIVSKLSPDEKQALEGKLKQIVNCPWSKLDQGLTECPRFRFRDYKDVDNFTVISDKKVRVQDPSMAFPYMNPGRPYIEVPEVYSDKTENRNIVIRIADNNATTHVDGKLFKW